MCKTVHQSVQQAKLNPYLQVCWDMVLEHFDDACIHEGFVRFR